MKKGKFGILENKDLRVKNRISLNVKVNQMINESEMKTKNEKKEMEFVCKANMALHLKWGTRPNVVLEEHIGAFGKKKRF